MIQQKLQFQKISQEQCNKIYNFSEINELYNNSFTTSPKGVYYPYNYGVRDTGWGCAWRAIQTLLSTQGIQVPMEQLYAKLSQKDDLISILKSAEKYEAKVIEQLTQKTWAPADIPSHWAEPFIGSIACHFYKIPHSLLLLNGPAQSYAPETVFESTISFKQFYQLMRKVIGKSSIMIDDGKYALSIIGLNQDFEDKVEMLFADPHIKSNRVFPEVGVYRKTFDLQGKSIEYQQTENQQQEALYSVYEKIDFYSKCWMICILKI